MKLAALVLMALAPGRAVAQQATHVPPEFAVKPASQAVLEICPPSTSGKPGAFAASTLVVHGGKLYLMYKTRAADIIPLGDKNLTELADAIRSRYDSLEVLVREPDTHTQYLADTTISLDSECVGLYGGFGGPSITLATGVSFGMNERGSDPTTGTPSFLSRAGIQVDFAGRHRFGKWLGSQVRIGVRTNADLGGEDQTPQVESVIESAEAIDFSVSLEVTPPFLRRSQWSLIVPMEVGTTWSSIPPFRFPESFGVRGGAPIPLDDAFAPDVVENAREILNESRGNGIFLAGLEARFFAGTARAYYVRFSLGTKWVERRRIGFAADTIPIDTLTSNIIPDSISLDVERFDQARFIWRLGAGIRFGGILDLRLDAEAPFRHVEGGETLMRIVLAKSFALLQ